MQSYDNTWTMEARLCDELNEWMNEWICLFMGSSIVIKHTSPSSLRLLIVKLRLLITKLHLCYTANDTETKWGSKKTLERPASRRRSRKVSDDRPLVSFENFHMRSAYFLALRSKMKAKALRECDAMASKYAECASGRTFSVVWKCRPQFKLLNECLHQ